MCHEYNVVPKSEFNDNAVVNDSFGPFALEINSSQKIEETNKNQSYSKNSSKTLMMRLISSFIFVCAAVASIQIGLYIPVFSEIFSQNVDANSILVPNFNFKAIDIGSNKISFVLNIDNSLALSSEDYYLYLVEETDANDENLDIWPAAVIEDGKTKIISNTVSMTYTKYTSSVGQVKIKSKTNYAILIVKDNKILQKTIVSTKEFFYISSIKIKTNSDLNYRYLLFQPVVNPEFENYNALYFELINLKTGARIDDYSILYKEYITESWALIPFVLTEPVCEYKLKIYCSTDHPDDVEYTGLFAKDGINYYLIYTYDEIIIY